MLSHNLGQNSGFNHVRSKHVLLVLHGTQRGNVSVSFPTPQREKEACLEYYTLLKAGYMGCRGVSSRGDILERGCWQALELSIGV